jgi:hypothetical protein
MDSNDDGRIDIADAQYIFNYLFAKGPQIPAPFPEAGVDPTFDELSCGLKDSCQDGTPFGQCSENMPKYCNNEGELVDNCRECGCPEGMVCLDNGQCLEAFCDDGTPANQCSSQKPYFCFSGGDRFFLEPDCVICGCAEGEWCDPESYRCYPICDDGTVPKQCSENKPKYCTLDGFLVDDCLRCGCPEGLECDNQSLECSISTKKTYRAKKAKMAIAIDGNPEEWLDVLAENIPHSSYVKTDGITTFDPVESDQDCSAVFKAVWDDTYLYVLIEVKDDAIYHDSSRYIWDDDSVEVYLDGDRDGGRSYGKNDFQLTVNINNDYGGIRSEHIQISHAVAVSDLGYRVEYAIPFSSLEVNPSEGIIIGFDVAINDDDDGGKQDSQIMWNGDGTNWQDKSQFGNLILTK